MKQEVRLSFFFFFFNLSLFSFLRGLGDSVGRGGGAAHVILEYLDKRGNLSFPANRQLMLFSIISADLERSTAIFGRLADTNAMAQILYGLALRCVFFQSISLSPFLSFSETPPPW